MSEDSFKKFLDEKPGIDPKAADGKYKTLFEQINAAALLTTFEGQILEANQKSCELFGYRWNELLHLSLKDLLTTETDWSQFLEEIAARGGINVETECMRKDGSYVPVEISVSLFRMGGKPVMFVLVWDITERRHAETRLRESEKKYHGLFEYTTDGIFVLDPRGNIVDVNTKMCEMLDVAKDGIIGKNLLNSDLLTAKSLPVVVNQFEQLLSEKTANVYRTELKNRRGEVLDVEVSSFFLVKKDDEVDNFVLIVRDVTARDESEKRRIIEHQLFKTLLDNIPDSVYFKDSENRFILVNKAKAMHSNVSPEEMIGKTDFDFLPEDQARKSFEDDKLVLQSGRAIVNKVEKITHSDGSERWVSVTKIPHYNAEGEIIGTMGISRDITLQEKARYELAEAEGRYRALFENSSFAIFLTDENGNIVSWNKAVEDLLAMSHNDLYLKPIEAFYPIEEWEKIQSVQGEGVKYRLETRIFKKDRGLIDVDLTVNVLKSEDGKVLGSMHIIYDISRRKKAEERFNKEHGVLVTLMESVPDSIYVKDEQNRFILVNRVKAGQWNVNPNDVVGKNDFDFLPHNEAQRVSEEDNRILETGESVMNRVEKTVGPDGSERRFLVTKVPVHDREGKIIGIIGISRDVTEMGEGLRKEEVDKPVL
jgi:PAS domain S-box-containing protein